MVRKLYWKRKNIELVLNCAGSEYSRFRGKMKLRNCKSGPGTRQLFPFSSPFLLLPFFLIFLTHPRFSLFSLSSPFPLTHSYLLPFQPSHTPPLSSSFPAVSGLHWFSRPHHWVDQVAPVRTSPSSARAAAVSARSEPGKPRTRPASAEAPAAAPGRVAARDLAWAHPQPPPVLSVHSRTALSRLRSAPSSPSLPWLSRRRRACCAASAWAGRSPDVPPSSSRAPRGSPAAVEPPRRRPLQVNARVNAGEEEPVRPGFDRFGSVRSGFGPFRSGRVRFDPFHPGSVRSTPVTAGQHRSPPVNTGHHRSTPVKLSQLSRFSSILVSRDGSG